MPVNKVPSVPLSEFYKLRSTFEKAARDRREERSNFGDDTPYNLAILEEMFMYLLGLYKPLVEDLERVKTLLGVEEGKE